jgi:hypothetical protein
MLTKPSRQNSRKKGIGTDWILNALEGLPSICLIVRRFLWYLKGLQPSSPLHSRRFGWKRFELGSEFERLTKAYLC